MKIDFIGKKVLVTGHSRGIGKAIYDMFKENGATVFGLSSSECDLYNLNDVKLLFNYLKNLDIDILINCAGVNWKNSIENVSVEEIMKMMNVNFYTPIILCQSVIENMKKKKWGRIINIGSIYANSARDNRLGYISSKHALLGATRSMAEDLKEYGITVNMISPDVTDTDMTRTMLGAQANEMELLSVEKIAKKVLVACSPLNDRTTGINSIVNSSSL